MKFQKVFSLILNFFLTTPIDKMKLIDLFRKKTPLGEYEYQKPTMKPSEIKKFLIERYCQISGKQIQKDHEQYWFNQANRLKTLYYKKCGQKSKDFFKLLEKEDIQIFMEVNPNEVNQPSGKKRKQQKEYDALGPKQKKRRLKV